MQKITWTILILALILPAGKHAHSQADALWGAWFYDPSSDTLYLITDQGEQASLKRPRLPDEQPGSAVDMTISRDGRYMVLTAGLNSGAQGMGIYGFETGQFIQTYTATLGDVIVLGTPYIFDPLSRSVAIGFWNEGSTAWVVIVYDVTTGDVINRIGRNSSLVTTALGAEPAGIVPQVVYFDRDTIHFQITEANDSDNEVAAIAWNYNENSAESSAYTFAPMRSDFLVTAGSTLPLFLIDTAEGAGFDGVASGTPSSPSVLWSSDSTQNIIQARWVGEGSLIALATIDDANSTEWKVIDFLLDAAEPVSIAANVTEVYGIPGGFLSLDNTGTVTQHTMTDAAAGDIVWTAPNPNVESVWVTPSGGALLVTNVAQSNVPSTVVTGIPPTAPPSSMGLCAGAPESRMSLNIQGRITSGFTPTRIRTYPSTAAEQIGEMVEGEVFDVLAGPQCSDGFVWWAVRTSEGRMGWAAEGTIDSGALNYFMTPIAGSTAAYTFASNAVVNSTELNVRANPGLGGELLMTTERGVELMVLGRVRSSVWVLVANADGSVAGWVATELLRAESSLLRAPVIDTLILPSRN